MHFSEMKIGKSRNQHFVSYGWADHGRFFSSTLHAIINYMTDGLYWLKVTKLKTKNASFIGFKIPISIYIYHLALNSVYTGEIVERLQKVSSAIKDCSLLHIKVNRRWGASITVDYVNRNTYRATWIVFEFQVQYFG